VPSNEPDDGMRGTVVVSAKRVLVKLPVAPVKRPAPPVMVNVSSICKRSGVPPTASPVTVVKIWSPLAAVNVRVPAPIAVTVLMVKSETDVNRPRQVLRCGGRGDASCGEAEKGSGAGDARSTRTTSARPQVSPRIWTPMHADTGWIGRHCVDPRLGVSSSKMKGRHPVDAAA
jgi:hypothetical protein